MSDAVTTYRFTDEMGEISGFGGSYEECCRQMLISALEWVDEHNVDMPPQWTEYERVFGLTNPENQTAETLKDVMVEAAKDVGEKQGWDRDKSGPTGAQMHAVVRSFVFVQEHGWNSYVEHMSQDND